MRDNNAGEICSNPTGRRHHSRLVGWVQVLLQDCRQEKDRPNVSDSESKGKCPSRHVSQQSHSCQVASNHLQPTTLDNLFKIADSPHVEVFAGCFTSESPATRNSSVVQVNIEALLAWSDSIGSSKPSTCSSSLDVVEGASAVRASRRSLQSQVSASGPEMARVPVGLRHLGSQVDNKSMA